MMDQRFFFNRMIRILFRDVAYWAVLVLAPLLLPEVDAHPHIFIEQQLNVVFDDQGLAGIKVRWKFDDMFASMIAEDHDVNRNGKFEAGEIKAVEAKAFAFIAEYHYFTFIRIGNVPFEVKFVKDFNAILKNRQLVYEFLIPCHVTATNQVKTVAVASYDPSYYSAIYFTRQAPVALTAAGDFDVKTCIKEDPDTKIYFDMVHPWALFMEFRRKS
jgi:ABC-type uncharacterized transport system substrate-binding protein